MSCIPFSIECTILLPFPFSLAIVDDFTAGVARFLPYTFPPHPSVVLSVRSIQTGGLGYIETFSLPDILLGGGGGLGTCVGGCLFQLGSVNSVIFPAIGLVSVGMINTQKTITCEVIKKKQK
jgi:hypothetical protein